MTITKTMTTYPSKEEVQIAIEQTEETPEEIALRTALAEWKKTSYSHKWKKMNLFEKSTALESLGMYLTATLTPDDPRKDIKFAFSITPWCFFIKSRTINIYVKNPSIISLLHEFGHALYGINELTAQTFALRLFKDVFPVAFKKLVWDGHMMKLPT